MQIIGKKLGCVQLHILNEQYKRTELKVSYIKKELTLNNTVLNERSNILVYFIDPDGMQSVEFDIGDLEIEVDMGYTKVSSTTMTGAVNFSGAFEAKMNESGQVKFENNAKAILKEGGFKQTIN